MKRILLLCVLSSTVLIGFAQTDTTSKEKTDTIKIGGMIIIRKPGGDREIYKQRKGSDSTVKISGRRYNKPSNISTNWWIVDLGFSNYNDKTNYSSAAVQSFAPNSNEDMFKLKNFKSRNVNIWFFMQKLNVAKHILNLKYGLGLELNNYHFDEEQVKFSENPTVITIDPAFKDKLKKNKLAADYITVPLMLNINFTPGRGRGFGISGGVSAGYLYSSRQKVKYNGGKKDKLKDDFDLEKWKISYVGEVLLGPVKLYGSYSPNSMWSKALDQRPYTFGVRFSNW
ncbi:MAG: hypothetical protein C4308_09180 [Chitinophagaceae bacterium]